MPRWLRLLERCFLHPDDREYVGGDLQEEYARRQARQGRLIAAAGYLNDLLSASPRRWRGLAHRLWSDIQFATRALRRRPAFTIAAVATLALGIGATTAIFVVAHAALLMPLPYPAPDRLLFVSSSFPGAVGGGDQLSYLDIHEIAARATTVAAVEPYHTGRALNLRGGTGDPERVRTNFVGSGYLSILGARAVSGRILDARDDQAAGASAIVVTHDFWVRRLGSDPGIVGRVVTLDGVAMTVVGVLEPGFRDVSAEEGHEFASDVFAPVHMLRAFGARALLDERTSRNFWALAPVRDGVPVEQARREVAAIGEALQREMADTNRGFSFWAVRLDEHLARDIRAPILLVAAGSAFVLLIACANVANLLFARLSSRGREIAIRRAIGARLPQIAGLVFAEAGVLAVLGGLAGLAAAAAAHGALEQAVPGELAPRLANARFGLATVGFVGLLTATVAIVLGAMGAVRCGWTAKQPAAEGPRGAAASDGSHARRLLLAAEVAFALMLAVGAMLMLGSLGRLRASDFGFNHARLVTMRLELPASRYPDARHVVTFGASLRDALTGVAGVESAALWGPGRPGRNTWITFPGRADTPTSPERMMTWRHTITPGALKALEIPLVAGREFTTADTADTQPVVVVSETIARTLWPGEDPLGKQLRWRRDLADSPVLTVVGVAADASHRGRLNAMVYADRDVYVPHAQRPDRLMVAVIRAQGDPITIVPSIRQRVRALDPDLPLFEIATMNQHMAQEEAETRFAAMLLTTYGALALALSAIGVYGVLGYHVAIRRRELAVRLALGASRGRLLREVVAEGMKPALAGILVGLAGAIALSRFIASLLYEVQPRDPVTLATVAAALVLTTLLATLLPARSATRADPMETLRAD